MLSTENTECGTLYTMSHCDIEAAFLAWETDQRLNPDRYATDAEADEMPVHDVARQCADDFVRCLAVTR
jgi:hypothetical protein